MFNSGKHDGVAVEKLALRGGVLYYQQITVLDRAP